MKKLIFTGLAVLLSLAIVSCNAPGSLPDDETSGRTNVEYLTDSSGNLTGLTLYLEGNAPQTNSSRALTKDLAMAGSDFFEVVFVYNSATPQIARASWEIGESAGISNVYRTAGGVSYAATGAATLVANTGYAVLFVGKKTDKTLLAIGKLDTSSASISTITTKVTFEIASLTAGLKAAGTAAATGDTFLTGTAAGAITTATAANTNLDTATFTVSPDAYPIPVYRFTAIGVYPATYTLGTNTGTASDYLVSIVPSQTGNATTNTLTTIKAPARFVLKDTSTKDLPLSQLASNTTAYVATTAGTGLTAGAIPLSINVGATSGFCSLSFAVPVYAISNTSVTTTANSVEWFLRSGYVTANYDLDMGDSKTAGAILLAVGNVSLNYIAVGTTWQ